MTKYMIKFEACIFRYMKLRALGYKTAWCGNNLICMERFYKE